MEYVDCIKNEKYFRHKKLNEDNCCDSDRNTKWHDMI